MTEIRTCKDHPEANGRQPVNGERAYTLRFPLETGNDLIVRCGEETFEHFSNMIGSMILDDENDTTKNHSGN
jgi:hypothetical protein